MRGAAQRYLPETPDFPCPSAPIHSSHVPDALYSTSFAKGARAWPKSKTVSKAELVNEVADSTGLSKKSVKETLDALLGTMTDNIAKGNKVTLTGFGTFEVRKRKARTGVKPGHHREDQDPGQPVPRLQGR